MKTLVNVQASRLVLALIALLSVIWLAPAQPAAASGLYSFDFEKTVAPWKATGNVALGQGYGENMCPPAGVGSALLKIIAPPCCLLTSPLAATAGYMTAAFAGSGADTVTVDWAAEGINACQAGCMVLIYVGSSPPTAASKPSAARPLKTPGWNHFHYTTATAAGQQASDMIYVGLGVQGWPAAGKDQSNPALAIDCVTVSIVSNAR